MFRTLTTPIRPRRDRVHPYKPGPLLCDPHTGVVCKRVVDLLQPAPPNEEAMTDTVGRATSGWGGGSGLGSGGREERG